MTVTGKLLYCFSIILNGFKRRKKHCILTVSVDNSVKYSTSEAIFFVQKRAIRASRQSSAAVRRQAATQ